MTTKKNRILAVDDESDVLLILKTALMSEGFEVSTATNGIDALAIADDKEFDVFILDMMMPEMTGFEVLRQVRENPKHATTPVLMLTGVSDRSKIREALDLGIAYYVVKPFEFHDLLSKINLVLNDDENTPPI